MKRGWLVLGVLCFFLTHPVFADEPSEEIESESAEDMDEMSVLDAASESEAPDGSMDYDEIYQIHTLERTLIPDDGSPEMLTTPTALPVDPMGLSPDTTLHLLLGSGTEGGHKRGLQRQNSRFMATALGRVKQQLSAPGTSIEQPFDLDCTSQAAVQEYLAIFSSPGSKTMKTWLKRMGKYKDVLERALSEEGVPLDLVYLAMIESGFKPRVKSPAQAAGMWQFMAGTARDMGLRIDEYVDERYDPIKAAHAAARYLKKQYDRYHSWPLAMAAYNGGAGTVNVAIDRFNTNDYFKLVKYGAMYDETRRYVPRILAAAIIGRNLKTFGFDGLTPESPFVFDTVEVPGNTKLAVIAEAAGCSLDTLKDLNPELLKDMTPPGGDYQIRIPLDRHRSFVEKFDRASSKYADTVPMVVGFGETLETISAEINVPARVLRNLNHLKSQEEVPYGTEILVPKDSRRTETPRIHAVFHVDEDGKPLGADETGGLPVVLVSPEKFTYSDRTRVFYETQKGDSVQRIAAAFGCLPNQVGIWNELDPWAKLRPQMILQLYVSDPDSLNNVRYMEESDVYVIVRGSDTHKDLIEAKKRSNKAGSKTSSGKTTTSARYVMHTVGKGDTLSGIASKYGVTLKSILTLNGIDEKTPIKKGQQLKIKKK